MPRPRDDSRAGLQPALVDSHVHFLAGQDSADFLDCAQSNFEAAAAELELGTDPVGFLLFADTPDSGIMALPAADATGAASRVGAWRLEHTRDATVYRARREDGAVILLVKGRQVRTREGLEVLALGCTADIPERMRFRDAVDAVRRVAALTAVPWGFGKWWFRRGRLVMEGIVAREPPPVYVADSALRPAGLPPPRPIRAARRSGRPVLAGTDPVGHGDPRCRAGSFGNLVFLDHDPDRPLDGLLRSLRRSPRPPPIYGRRLSLSDACRIQVALGRRRHGTRRRG